MKGELQMAKNSLKQYEVKMTVRTVEGTETISLFFDYQPVFSSLEIINIEDEAALIKNISALEWLNKNPKSRVAIRKK